MALLAVLLPLLMLGVVLALGRYEDLLLPPREEPDPFEPAAPLEPTASHEPAASPTPTAHHQPSG